MITRRKLFALLAGATVVIASPIRLKAAPKFTLWGDGIHNDSPAINAILRGETDVEILPGAGVVFDAAKRLLLFSGNGNTYLLCDSIKIHPGWAVKTHNAGLAKDSPDACWFEPHHSDALIDVLPGEGESTIYGLWFKKRPAEYDGPDAVHILAPIPKGWAHDRTDKHGDWYRPVYTECQPTGGPPTWDDSRPVTLVPIARKRLAAPKVSGHRGLPEYRSRQRIRTNA